MAAQSDDSLVEVILFDRQLPLQIPRQPTCEALWRSVARKELGIKPSTLELFGMYFYIDLFFINSNLSFNIGIYDGSNFKCVKNYYDSSERIINA